MGKGFPPLAPAPRQVPQRAAGGPGGIPGRLSGFLGRHAARGSGRRFGGVVIWNRPEWISDMGRTRFLLLLAAERGAILRPDEHNQARQGCNQATRRALAHGGATSLRRAAANSISPRRPCRFGARSHAPGRTTSLGGRARPGYQRPNRSARVGRTHLRAAPRVRPAGRMDRSQHSGFRSAACQDGADPGFAAPGQPHSTSFRPTSWNSGLDPASTTWEM